MLRSYRESDCPALARLFFEAVHQVTDYTPRQLWAWAPGQVDEDAWNRSFLAHTTLVYEEDGEILGFGDMDGAGYLDRLYVHPAHQRRGIAGAICDALEAAVPAARYTTHASIPARPFFAARGYRVLREQRVVRRGTTLTNFVMEKENPR